MDGVNADQNSNPNHTVTDVKPPQNVSASHKVDWLMSNCPVALNVSCQTDPEGPFNPPNLH